MAVGLSATEANTIVDGLDATWIQLHTADPGASGTANVATETTRKQISLAAASAGSADTDADLEWTSIAGSQDATHFSLWSASTGGTFRFSGTITADPYAADDTFTIYAGDLTITVSTVAA
jgi:hypothetical protein